MPSRFSSRNLKGLVIAAFNLSSEMRIYGGDIKFSGKDSKRHSHKNFTLTGDVVMDLRNLNH